VKNLFLCGLLVWLSGCALFSNPSVPATEIRFNPQTDALKIISPKNVMIQSVVISKSSTNFAMTVTGYSSTNDGAIVSTVMQAQSLIASNAAVTIQAITANAAKAAAGIP
jgi:hypothetical protein